MSRPPSSLDGAEVLYWAWSAPVPFFVMGDGTSGVPIHGLAICRYPDSGAIYRFSCGLDWEVENDSAHESVQGARRAESSQGDVRPVEWHAGRAEGSAQPLERSAAEGALVALLQLACSGERAAGLAYRGHWRSVVRPEERLRIQTIEEEEWHHRRLVADMLLALGVAPDRWRELRALGVGRVLGVLCHVGGWLAPMYGAGKLESRNIREYENAARLARDCGRGEWVDCLLTMAEVEWEHEHYSRGKVEQHWLGRRLRLWPAPPAKETIRARFRAQAGEADERVSAGA